MARYSIELGVVRRMLEKCKVSVCVGSCKNFVRRMEVFDRVGSCKENVRRNVRYLIELRAVRSLLGEM